ncbi:hypothetical protein QYM36_017192 [Artemia franciscana]|uniref:Stromal cell-derived factor 4 n=2 Tax=Artemia franciscana TaxID=6661 RepID=A0AA88H559_ARTSF|nr:hypothetical protein QYM36_017192 [Artemia franciscana]
MLFGLFALVRLSVRTTQNIDEYENEGYTLSKEEEELLLALFPRVDVNNDHLWSLEEMEKWISQRVRDHVRAAMKDNVFLFTKIDRSPRDEQLAWNKAQWSEATRSNTSSLDLDEFLSFLHPESSVATLLDRVDNVILQLDHDSDGFLRWDEFTFVTSRTISIQDYFSEYELQRFQNKYSLKKEFSIADKDKSDTIDRGELTAYLDPRNPRRSKLDAMNLLQLADNNKDSMLDTSELLKHGKSFLDSKMVDAAKVFHEEI